MTEQETKEIKEIKGVAGKLQKLPENFKDVQQQTFHRIYTSTVSTGKDGSPSLDKADPKKAAEVTSQYFVDQLCRYLGIKGGLGKDFLGKKADASGTTFRDLFLMHNGFVPGKAIENLVSEFVKKKDVNAVLPTLTQTIQKLFEQCLEKQTEFVSADVTGKIASNAAYQKAAQNYTGSKDIGKSLVDAFYKKASGSQN